MDKKQAWLQLVREKSQHYLNLHDGGFDERMQAQLESCDYEEQTVTYSFPTLTWQINEKGGIHGGAIAGMFDTALGVVANFTAGENEVALWRDGVHHGNGPQNRLDAEAGAVGIFLFIDTERAVIAAVIRHKNGDRRPARPRFVGVAHSSCVRPIAKFDK